MIYIVLSLESKIYEMTTSCFTTLLVGSPKNEQLLQLDENFKTPSNSSQVGVQTIPNLDQVGNCAEVG